MVAAIERIEPQRILRTCGPQPQGVDETSAPPDHRRIVSDRIDGFRRMPDVLRTAVRRRAGLDDAAEADLMAGIRPGDLPRITEAQPVLGILLLPAILDDLTEHAVIVADAIAMSGDGERGHALHEAGGQPSEAAIAQRCVMLDVAQPVVVNAEFGECRTHAIDQAEIVERVVQQPADQELQRQVIDAFALGNVVVAGRSHPALEHMVAHGQRGRDEPVPVGGDNGVTADRVGQLMDHALTECGDVFVFRRDQNARCIRAGDQGRAHDGDSSGQSGNNGLTAGRSGEKPAHLLQENIQTVVVHPMPGALDTENPRIRGNKPARPSSAGFFAQLSLP